MSLTYVSGDWTGLATGTGVVLLAPTVPSVTVRAVWDALAAGAPITQWLEIIAGGGISSLPSFALVERTPDGVRVLLRGDVVVVVDGTEVAARGMSTWREEFMPASEAVEVRAVVADGESWPLLGGVVRASRVRLDLVDAEPVTADSMPDLVPVGMMGGPIGRHVASFDDEPEPASASAEAAEPAAAPAPTDSSVDESGAPVGPIDVFEEAGFGPASGMSDTDEAAAEPGDASAEALEESEDASAEALEEPEDASAEALEESEDASAEAHVEPVDASAEAHVEPVDASAEAHVEPVDASAEALEESEDASAEAPTGPDEPAVADDEPDASAEAHEEPDASAEAPEDPADDPTDAPMAEAEAASAEAPALAVDAAGADQPHEETYVGPLPDLAPPGALDADHDAEQGADHAASSEAAPAPEEEPEEEPVETAGYGTVAPDGPGAVPPPPGAVPPPGPVPPPPDQAAAAAPPAPPVRPTGTPTAEYQQVGPVSSGLIDSLPWNMPNAEPAPPQPPSPVPTFDPPSVGDAEIEGDHDGETILVSHLRTAYAQDAADAVPNQPPSATIVPGVADDALYDEPRPVIMLAVSSGPRVPLDRVVLIGRAPESSRFAGALMPRLVTVPSPQQDISRTHVEVRLEGDHVVVTDLRSTNGTMVAVPGNDPRRLHPGEGVPVPVGSVIDLGDGITIAVESHGPHGPAGPVGPMGQGL